MKIPHYDDWFCIGADIYAVVGLFAIGTYSGAVGDLLCASTAILALDILYGTQIQKRISNDWQQQAREVLNAWRKYEANRNKI